MPRNLPDGCALESESVGSNTRYSVLLATPANPVACHSICLSCPSGGTGCANSSALYRCDQKRHRTEARIMTPFLSSAADKAKKATNIKNADKTWCGFFQIAPPTSRKREIRN